MERINVRLIEDASLTELTLAEQREIVGGSAISFYVGYAIGWTVGAAGAMWAAGVFVITNLGSSDPWTGSEQLS
jgi:hypothetical protein